jgi:hypothetical protein
MLQTHQGEVSPSIVRAWFDTVLNPLIYGLRIESSVLHQGNLTWRFRLGRPVSLVPVRSLLMDAFHDNLDQFLTLHPEFVAPMKEHDMGLGLLIESCRKLESTLINSEEMRSLFQRLTTPEALGGQDVAEVFRAIRPEDRLKVVAELMINSVTELPDYYSMADFWYVHHGEFLKLRETPAIRPFWETTYHAAERLLQEVDQLIDLLKKVQETLSSTPASPSTPAP